MNSKFRNVYFFSCSSHTHCTVNTAYLKMAIELTTKVSLINVGTNGKNNYFNSFTIGNILTHPTHKSESNNSSEIVIMLNVNHST